MPRTVVALLVLALIGAVGCTDRADPDPAADERARDPVSTPADEPEQAASPEGLERVAEAARATLEAGSARFDLVVELPGTAVTGGEAAIEGDGEEDFETGRRRITTQGPAGRQEIVVDGSVAYVALPARGAEQWGRFDVHEVPDDAGVGFAGPAGLALRGSDVMFALLADAASAATEVGQEQVDDQPATRYAVTLAHEDIGAVDEHVGAALSRLDATQALTVDVWVGDDGMIRQLSYTGGLDSLPPERGQGDAGSGGRADSSAGGRGGAAEDATDDRAADGGRGDVAGTVTLTYRDFGADVDVAVPDQETVLDLGA